MTDHPPAARLVPPAPGEGGRSHWRVTEFGLKVVEELAARGCHVATIARALGMDASTLRAVRQRQPEVQEAYERGLAKEHDVLVSNLRVLADGGNVVANLFLLKARHGYREGNIPEDQATGVEVGGVLVVPPRQTVAAFLEQHGAGPISEWDGPPSH